MHRLQCELDSQNMTLRIVSPGYEDCRMVSVEDALGQRIRIMSKHLSSLAEVIEIGHAISRHSSEDLRSDLRRLAVVRLVTCFKPRQGFPGLDRSEYLQGSDVELFKRLEHERDKAIAHSDDVDGSPYVLAAVSPEGQVRKVVCQTMRASVASADDAPFDLARRVLERLSSSMDAECESISEAINKSGGVSKDKPNFSLTFLSPKGGDIILRV